MALENLLLAQGNPAVILSPLLITVVRCGFSLLPRISWQSSRKEDKLPESHDRKV